MPPKQFNQVMIKLMDASHGANVPLSSSLHAKHFWLRSAVRLNRSIVVGNLREAHERTPEVIPTWPNPSAGQAVRFEVSTELPVFIPNRDGQWEFEVAVNGSVILVANRMVRCRFRPASGETDEYTYTVTHHHHIPALKALAEGGIVFVEPMRTVVSMSFRVTDGRGSEAFERLFWDWSEQLLAGANAILNAVRVSARDEQDLHLNTNSRPIYLVAAWPEDDEGEKGVLCLQVAGNVAEAALLPTSGFGAVEWARVDAILGGKASPDRVDVAISQAKTFRRFGYNDLALIHLCVAAESLLGRAFESHLAEQGVHERTIKTRIREISSLSLLLSIHANLFLDLRADHKAAQAIGAIDWARGKRNEVVHGGGSVGLIDEQRLREAIDGLGYLKEVIRGEKPSAAGV